MEQVSNPLVTLRGRLREFFRYSGQRSAQGHISSTSIPTHLQLHLPQNPPHPHSHRSCRQGGFRVSPEPATVAFGYLRGLWRNFDITLSPVFLTSTASRYPGVRLWRSILEQNGVYVSYSSADRHHSDRVLAARNIRITNSRVAYGVESAGPQHSGA